MNMDNEKIDNNQVKKRGRPNKYTSEENNEINKRKSSEYYHKNRDTILSKTNIRNNNNIITCPICNCSFLKVCKKQHEHTLKHMKNHEKQPFLII